MHQQPLLLLNNNSMIIQLVSPGGSSETIQFSDLLARSPKTLLYFYPKDNTPGCTLEAQDFTRLLPQFQELGIQVLGVSRDDEASHTHFQDTCGLAIPLIADTGELCDAFSVMGEKNLYGKIIFGLLRSTFVLDAQGNVLREWRSVRATGHADRVLRELS
jgi:peroxiredoxin Q/BCP